MDIKELFKKGTEFQAVKKIFFYEKFREFYYQYEEKHHFNYGTKAYNDNQATAIQNVVNQLYIEKISFQIEKKDNQLLKIKLSNIFAEFFLGWRNKRLMVKFSSDFFIRNYSWYIDEWKIQAIVNLILAVDKNFPNWEAELKTIALEYEKMNKISKISTLRLNIILSEKMKSLGIPYIIENEATKVVLKIKMKYKRMLTINFSHKFSNERIETLLNFVDTLPQFIENAGNSISISGYGNNIKWINKP